MQRYDYLIVGGGMAADAAVRAIRARDTTGSIALFSSDRYPPYQRPYLSKQLWKGEKLEHVFWPPFPAPAPTECYGTSVVRLDPRAHTVMTASGQEVAYGRLLLATGGSPRRLPFGEGLVTYLRSLDDYLTIFRTAAERERFLVVGAGFIGAEMAAALTLAGRKVSLVFPEANILERILPAELAAMVSADYKERGVSLYPGETLQQVRREGDGILASTSGGRTFQVDAVVAGLGLDPNTGLAETAGLTLAEGGILVDQHLATSAPDVYAAGDVAAFFSPPLGRTVRVEHEQNARLQGEVAGANMAGAEETLEPLPLFYSDLFDLGFEAVGRLEAGLETWADWQEPGREGVVYYLEDGRVVGVLDWNVWDGIDVARKLIGSREAFPDLAQLRRRREELARA